MKPKTPWQLERVIRTSAYWRRYFEANATSQLEIPWRAGPELTAEESAAVARSIQGFQRGESSDGRRLRRYAADHARRTGDIDYVQAIRLFIAEEQRHARDLGRFLTQNGIPLQRSNAPDRVFRGLRHLLGNLEISISVLLTAEIIAKVYYAALKEATASTVLRELCSQILRDERKHVEFQSEQLGKLQAGRGGVSLAITTGLRRVLFRAACVVVWFFHGRALEKGNISFRGFWRWCRREFDDSLQITFGTRDACRYRSEVMSEQRPRVRGFSGNYTPARKDRSSRVSDGAPAICMSRTSSSCSSSSARATPLSPNAPSPQQ
jgi:hypothetical protein